MNDWIKRNKGSDAEKRIEQLAVRLPRSVVTESDLWPRIAARIDIREDRRIRQLPREIEATRDLWPEILAGLRARGRTEDPGPDARRTGFGVAAAIGLLALAALTTWYSIRPPNVTENVTASTIEPGAAADVDQLPALIDDLLGQITNADPGMAGAELQEAAMLIRRDYLMVRSERLRIEEALTNSANDFNLRNQWRHIYVAELRLINEAQNLGNII